MESNLSLLDHISIVLVRPKIAENIGAAARVAFNMGINNLTIVADSLPEREPMAKMATHKAVHIVDNLNRFDSLGKALSDSTVVVGTTARRGKLRFVQQSPREMVEKLRPMLPTNKISILFGPEDTGLTNDDLKFCQMTSAIPTADFSSLNLAQAVAIHCYEIYNAIVHTEKNMVTLPTLATSFELESMYGYLEKSLLAIDFIEKVSHIYWMSNIRNFFNRVSLSSKDANIIRGICKKFLLHQGKEFK